MKTLAIGHLGVSVPKRPKLLAFIIAMAAIFAGAALADPVKWTLDNVVVSDGSTVSGSFVYDADTKAYSAIDITTSAARGPFTETAYAFNNDGALVAHQSPAQTNQNAVVLFTIERKRNVGGTVTLITASNNGGFARCIDSGCTTTGRIDGADAYVSGTLVGVPLPIPTVVGIAPSSGSTSGGNSIVISGTNLSNATGVTVGGAAATITANTATSITVTAPVGASGVADVLVTTADGTSRNTAADNYTYIVPAPVPTMSEWAMILLGVIMSGGAALYVQQRRQLA